MNKILILLCLIPFTGCQSTMTTLRSDEVPEVETAAPEAASLIGTWRIDLRPTPDAEPYYQEMVIESVDDNTITGTFYGAEITDGRLNLNWDAVHFAFVTSDGVGNYNTSGVIDGDAVRGTTHAIGREFLSVWTGTKIDP